MPGFIHPVWSAGSAGGEVRGRKLNTHSFYHERINEGEKGDRQRWRLLKEEKKIVFFWILCTINVGLSNKFMHYGCKLGQI